MTIQAPAPLKPETLTIDLKKLNTGKSTPWIVQEDKLCKTFIFQDFTAAFAFMTHVALIAEKMDHHPDWMNVYNRVDIRLNTHDAGDKITNKDFELAKKIEDISETVIHS